MTTERRDGVVPTIEAAGGVVLRQGPRGPQVLVVHRPAHDDWSLPKGKLDPGEDAATAAVREVAEETGVVARPGPELPSVAYRVGDADKHVRWFRMDALDGDPADRPPDDEVDEARWLTVADAFSVLSYRLDQTSLIHALNGPPT